MSLTIRSAEPLAHGGLLVTLADAREGPRTVYAAVVQPPDPEAGISRPWPFPILAVDPDGEVTRIEGAQAVALAGEFEHAYYVHEEDSNA